MTEHLNSTLQENILVILAHDDEYGRIIANQINTELFEGDYRVIAEHAVEYWRKYQEAPKQHTPDLVADILDDPKNKRHLTYRRILAQMQDLAGSVNTKYVMDQLHTFSRMQKLKAAILSSAEKLNMKQETAVEEIEEVWNNLLRVRENNYDPGMRLTDITRMMKFMRDQQSREFITGVPDLDSRSIVPEREKVFLFLASAGRGKSWWLINLAKQGIIRRHKVLYISLEMSEEEIVQRCYQNLFAVSTRKDSENNWVRTLEMERDKLVGFGEDDHTPDFTLDSDTVREELETRLSVYGTRFENLLVKRFPPRSVNMKDIRSFLDNLELVEKFIPDLLIVDYMGRIKTDIRHHRLNLGTEFEEYRGLCIERHMAGATAHQLSKEGAKSNQARATHVSEDFSFIMTADKVLTYSVTEAELEYGLARLYVDKGRSEKDHFAVLITQKYGLGQFCLQSSLLTSKYYDLFKQATGNEPKDDETSTNDEEDNDDD